MQSLAFCLTVLVGVCAPGISPASAETIFTYTVDADANATVTGCDGSCGFDLVIPSTIGDYPVTAIGDGAFHDISLTSVTIPDSVVTIGSNAFTSNSLTSVVIPNSVTTIGGTAFLNNQLTSATIPNSVTSIGLGAFATNALTSVSIPDSVTVIASGAFASNALTSITLPDGLTSIQDGAFANNALTSLTLPNSVTLIGDQAFVNNSLTSLTLPSSVTYVGEASFAHNALTSVSIPNSLSAIAPAMFWDNALTSVTIPSSVTGIGDWAFRQNALTSVKIPSGVTYLGNGTFSYNSLASVSIPNTASQIGAQAFTHNLLALVTIPKSVTQIGYGAFSDNLLTSARFLGNAPSIDFDNIFENNVDLVAVDVVTGRSGWSSSFAGLPVRVNYAPDAPSVTSLVRGNGSAVLTVSPASNDGGSPATFYVVEYKKSSYGSWTKFKPAVSGASQSFTIRGLTNGVAYDVRVSAVNALVGQGALSSVYHFTPATTPGAPKILSSRASNGKVYLSVRAPLSNGGDPRFYYQYTTNGGSTWANLGVEESTGYTAIFGLTNGTRYSIKVRVVNGVGGGAASNTVSATPHR